MRPYQAEKTCIIPYSYQVTSSLIAPRSWLYPCWMHYSRHGKVANLVFSQIYHLNLEIRMLQRSAQKSEGPRYGARTN